MATDRIANIVYAYIVTHQLGALARITYGSVSHAILYVFVVFFAVGLSAYARRVPSWHERGLVVAVAEATSAAALYLVFLLVPSMYAEATVHDVLTFVSPQWFVFALPIVVLIAYVIKRNSTTSTANFRMNVMAACICFAFGVLLYTLKPQLSLNGASDSAGRYLIVLFCIVLPSFLFTYAAMAEILREDNNTRHPKWVLAMAVVGALIAPSLAILI